MIPDIPQLWPDYQPTRLHELPELARRCIIARVLVKAKNERPLGNFKVLGGVIAGLRALAKAIGVNTVSQLLAQTRHSNHFEASRCWKCFLYGFRYVDAVAFFWNSTVKELSHCGMSHQQLVAKKRER